MLDSNVIEKSSRLGHRPVMVRKKDGSTRFCVDYRKLNDVTQKNSYPLPRIDDCIAELGQAQWFSTLDLESGYWQIEMDEASKAQTALPPFGAFQFRVMSFGLCNAPATFQSMMDLVLEGLKSQICLVYLDDVIVHSASFSTAVANLASVLDRVCGIRA